jgi:hypothetical protein
MNHIDLNELQTYIDKFYTYDYPKSVYINKANKELFSYDSVVEAFSVNKRNYSKIIRTYS